MAKANQTRSQVASAIATDATHASVTLTLVKGMLDAGEVAELRKLKPEQLVIRMDNARIGVAYMADLIRAKLSCWTDKDAVKQFVLPLIADNRKVKYAANEDGIYALTTVKPGDVGFRDFGMCREAINALVSAITKDKDAVKAVKTAAEKKAARKEAAKKAGAKPAHYTALKALLEESFDGDVALMKAVLAAI